MKFLHREWSDLEKYDSLSRWIIFHSFLYYELDTSIVNDHSFDSNCKQFLELVGNDSGKFKDCKWYYVMHDFDGSTGFHLFGRLSSVDRSQMEFVAERFYGFKRRLGV